MLTVKNPKIGSVCSGDSRKNVREALFASFLLRRPMPPTQFRDGASPHETKGVCPRRAISPPQENASRQVQAECATSARDGVRSRHKTPFGLGARIACERVLFAPHIHGSSGQFPRMFKFLRSIFWPPSSSPEETSNQFQSSLGGTEDERCTGRTSRTNRKVPPR
jgi:hypothetical protein